jgi:hypothetical protein
MKMKKVSLSYVHKKHERACPGSQESWFCALGFINEALRLNTAARILVLEGGALLLPKCFQNPFTVTLPDERFLTEPFPWGTCHLRYAYFGGRSVLRSAWQEPARQWDVEECLDYTRHAS